MPPNKFGIKTAISALVTSTRVRESGASQHHMCTIRGPLKPQENRIIIVPKDFKGALITPRFCREVDDKKWFSDSFWLWDCDCTDTFSFGYNKMDSRLVLNQVYLYCQIDLVPLYATKKVQKKTSISKEERSK